MCTVAAAEIMNVKHAISSVEKSEESGKLERSGKVEKSGMSEKLGK